MRTGWEDKLLKDICSVFGRIGFRGYTKADFVSTPDNGAITLSPSNIIGGELSCDKCSYVSWEKYYQSPEIMVFPGDILLVKTASIGKCALVRSLPHEATINPQFVVLKEIKVNHQYLTYFLQSPIAQKKFQEFAIGAAVPTFSQKKLEGLIVPTPSLPEQQRIVDILDREFTKIDALKANAEKSLLAAKDLFQATLKKELEPKEGWETKHLNEWATYSIGLTYKPADVSNEGTIVLRSSNIQNDELVFDDIVRVACKVKDELFVEDGDILMCSRNGSARLVGKVARIGKEQERMTYGTFMTIIRSKYNPILFYYFKSNDFRSQISKGENTMINQITKYMLNDVVISLPNDPREVSRIARSLDDLNDRCKSLQENYQKTLTLCDDLKQSLLRKAFNGEL